MVKIATAADMAQADTEAKFSPIPEGKYNFVMPKDAAFNTSKSTTNPTLEAEFEVFDGPFKGRKVFETFSNVLNPAPAREAEVTAQRIAREFWAGLAVACGKTKSQAEDTAVCVGIPFSCRIKLEAEKPNPNGGTYPARNRIAGGSFGPYNPALVAQQTAVTPAQAPVTPQMPGMPPMPGMPGMPPMPGAPQQPVYQQAPQQPVYQQAPQQPVYQQAPQQPVYQQAPQQPVYQQAPAAAPAPAFQPAPPHQPDPNGLAAQAAPWGPQPGR
jgi:hypothetical protein